MIATPTRAATTQIVTLFFIFVSFLINHLDVDRKIDVRILGHAIGYMLKDEREPVPGRLGRCVRFEGHVGREDHGLDGSDREDPKGTLAVLVIFVGGFLLEKVDSAFGKLVPHAEVIRDCPVIKELHYPLLLSRKLSCRFSSSRSLVTASDASRSIQRTSGS